MLPLNGYYVKHIFDKNVIAVQGHIQKGLHVLS